ncbi:MAG: hypothetical protein Q9207_007804, partial [Kuettlingeria erythrocarpa]
PLPPRPTPPPPVLRPARAQIRQPVVVTHTAARKSHAAPVYGKGPLRRSEVVGYAHAMNGVGFHPGGQQKKARKAVASGLSGQEAMMFAQASNYHPLKRG